MSKPTRPQPPRGLVAATKRPVIQQVRAKPIAPPVYRPQPTPMVLQRKTAQPQPPLASRHRTAMPHQARGVLQPKLKVGTKDAVVPMAQQIAQTDNNQYTKTTGNRDINQALDRALRKRIYHLVEQNNGASRFSSTASVTLNATSAKASPNASSIPWQPGPEYQPVEITCEYDLVGATHDNVPTPHVKIVIKPKNQNSYIKPFGDRVVALAAHEVVLILDNAGQDYLLPWVKTSIEKGLASRNVGKNITSADYKIK